MLSPSRLAQNISDSPSAVTVIDRETIIAMGARKIADVFRLVPGMITGSAYGNLPTVAYHGMSDQYARRIQVLVDGRSTWQPASGGVFWNNLPVPIEEIDRIEVIRAPNAASYGASAFSATINIYTRHSSEAAGNTVAASVGENGIDDRYLHHGGGFGPLSYSISGTRRHDSGYAALNDTRNDEVLFVRADYAMTRRDELSAEFGISEGDYDAGDNTFFSPTRTIRQKDDFEHLQWIRALSGGDEVKVTLSRNHFENLHRHPVGPIAVPPVGTLIFDYTFRVTRWDAELQHILLPDTRTRLVWGLGARRDEALSQAYFETDDTQVVELWRGFAHAEYHLTDDTLLNGGFMVEDSTLIDPQFSPRLALIHHLAPGHALRVSASTGTRLATLWEHQARQNIKNEAGTFTLYKTIASGVDGVEHAVSYDLGYVYQPHAGLTFDARVYSETLSDLVTQYLRNVEPGQFGYFNGYTQVLDFHNADEVSITGFEAQLDWRGSASDRLIASYAYTDIAAEKEENTVYERSAPLHQYAAMWSHLFGNSAQASILYTWQGNMAWLGEDEIDSYDRLDLRLAKQFRLGNGSRLRVELVGQNLSGSFSDYRNDPKWEKTYFASVGADF